MHAIILGLIIGCSKKTDNATSANTETTSTETTSTVMPDTTTVNKSTTSVSPSNSIEIKAIVRPKDAETEKSEEEILTLPEDADNIDDTVDPD